MNDNARTHADWIGRTVYGANGDKIGDVSAVYADDVTGRPDWMTVSTGWFGSAEQFVPIAGTSAHGDDLTIAFDEDTVKGAPSVEDDAHLSADEERRLYAHYGMDYDADPTLETDVERADEGYGYSTGRDIDRDIDRDTANVAGSGDASVVRSEEELDVDKVERDAGKARLRKYVVTDDVTMTVPVRKEVARITRETLDGGEGGAIADDDVVEEITLTEEEVVVDKDVVAKERVGLETETVTEDRTVSETVRKERIETDGETDGETDIDGDIDGDIDTNENKPRI